MKYDDFKIFKFSTISKIVNPKRYNFSRIYKNINFRRHTYTLVSAVNFVISIIKHTLFGIYKSAKFIRYHFLIIYKNINFKKYNFFRIYKYPDLRKYNFLRVNKYFDFRRYNFSKIYRYFDIKRYKNVPIYFVGLVFFSVLIYSSIPMFFSYDKSKLENILCKDLNIKCSIYGKIRYSFFPSPRIRIKDLTIQDFIDEKKILGKVDNVAIKISFYNFFGYSNI